MPVNNNPDDSIELPDMSLVKRYEMHDVCYKSYPALEQLQPLFLNECPNVLPLMNRKPFETLSLGVHIPFCFKPCHYCGYNKILAADRGMTTKYLGYLKKEMMQIQSGIGKRRIVTQLHLGGGTPTFLDSGELTLLMLEIAQNFRLSNDNHRDFSIKIDPRTITSDTLALLKGLGFNHIRFGIPGFNQNLQKTINREHTFSEIRAVVIEARQQNFHTINLNLLYGLPSQTQSMMTQTLEKVIALQPDRITLHHYRHTPGRFKCQQQLNKYMLPELTESVHMYWLTVQQLSKAGYAMLSMDRFALCCNNDHQLDFTGYNIDTIGVGVSAITQGTGFIYQNDTTLKGYYEALDKGRLPYNKGLVIKGDDLRYEAIVISLMTNFVVDIKAWENRFNLSFHDYFNNELNALECFVDDGLIFIDCNQVKITNKGKLLTPQIVFQFDRPRKNHSSKPYKAL